jgi:hypothetical protein
VATTVLTILFGAIAGGVVSLLVNLKLHKLKLRDESLSTARALAASIYRDLEALDRLLEGGAPQQIYATYKARHDHLLEVVGRLEAHIAAHPELGDDWRAIPFAIHRLVPSPDTLSYPGFPGAPSLDGLRDVQQHLCALLPTLEEPTLPDAIAARVGEQRRALAEAHEVIEERYRKEIVAATASTMELGKLLHYSFACSASDGLRAVGMLASSADSIDKGDIILSLGIVCGAVGDRRLSASQTTELANAVVALFTALPADARVGSLLKKIRGVHQLLAATALLVEYGAGVLTADEQRILGRALAERVAQIDNPWAILSERQLPAILAVWASVDPSAAAGWAANRIDARGMDEGSAFLEKFVMHGDGGVPELDSKRLGLLVSRSVVEAYLADRAQYGRESLVLVTKALRAVPVETWAAEEIASLS